MKPVAPARPIRRASVPGSQLAETSQEVARVVGGGLRPILALMRLPLRALAWLYGVVVRTRTALFEWGILRRRRLPRRVLSVGNLTVGGTGKTPVVIWLVERLLQQGLRVAVLSRGYRRRSRVATLLVSNGQQILASPSEAGDEPYLIATRCPGAIVAVGADRYRLGRWVWERHAVDCFVLDDGFQHLALHRDLDLLLVDSSDPDGLQGLLPAGRLREPLAAARRASAVILTRADDGPVCHAVMARLGAILQTWRPIRVRFVPGAVQNLRTEGREAASWLAGRSAVAFSGIANPGSFRRALDSVGARVVGEIGFSDHHWYDEADLDRIRALVQRTGAEVALTTEKDAVKLTSLLATHPLGERTWAVRVGVDVIEGGDRLERLIAATERTW